MTETIYIKNLGKEYPRLLNILENYVYFALRCLEHSKTFNPTPEDFTHLTFQRNNGQIAEAICYPDTSINETLQRVENPLFFYGFKADFDFKDMSCPIKITFSESFEELKK